MTSEIKSSRLWLKTFMNAWIPYLHTLAGIEYLGAKMTNTNRQKDAVTLGTKS